MKRSIAALLFLAACAPSKTTTPVGPTTPTSPEPEPVAEAPAPPVAEAPVPELAFPADEFRAKQPEAGAPRALQLPSITRFRLASGVSVFLAEDHALPTVSWQLSFETGAIDDPPGKEGLAAVCAATMGESTESLDTVAFAEAQADIASEVFVTGGSDQQSVGMATLSKHLGATAALWSELLRKPGWRQADFERIVQRQKSSLRQQKGSPAGLAGLLLGNVTYGESHPLGRIASEASLSAITLDDCKKWHADRFKPAGAQLWVVGDITRPQIEDIAKSQLAGWTGKPKASVKVGKPKARAGKIFFVDIPGAAQSQIYVSFVGPERRAKDFFANSLVGAIYGGGFASRINLNLREDKGYAYGARGNFSYTRYFGMFVASSSVRTDVTDKSVVEIFNELTKLATGEVTDEELNREKNSLILSLPSRFETAGGVLSAFRQLVYFGLPLDYYASFVKNATAVDKAAVAKSAKAHLKPKDAVVLVVGDKAQVLPGLEKLVADKTFGEGALVVLDADGKIAK